MSNMTLPCVNPIQLVPTIQKRAESCLQGSPRPRHKSQLMICPKQLPSKQAIPFHLHLESWKENNDHRCRLQGFESEPSCGNLQSVESCNFAVVSFVCLHLAGDAVLQHTIQWHSCKILNELHCIALKDIAVDQIVCLYRSKEAPYGVIKLMRSGWPPQKCHHCFERSWFASCWSYNMLSFRSYLQSILSV